jgi:hypothetical protein
MPLWPALLNAQILLRTKKQHMAAKMTVGAKYLLICEKNKSRGVVIEDVMLHHCSQQPRLSKK